MAVSAAIHVCDKPSNQEYAGPPAANRCECDPKSMLRMRVFATWCNTFELDAKVISQAISFPRLSSSAALVRSSCHCQTERKVL